MVVPVVVVEGFSASNRARKLSAPMPFPDKSKSTKFAKLSTSLSAIREPSAAAPESPSLQSCKRSMRSTGHRDKAVMPFSHKALPPKSNERAPLLVISVAARLCASSKRAAASAPTSHSSRMSKEESEPAGMVLARAEMPAAPALVLLRSRWVRVVGRSGARAAAPSGSRAVPFKESSFSDMHPYKVI